MNDATADKTMTNYEEPFFKIVIWKTQLLSFYIHSLVIESDSGRNNRTDFV